MRRRTVPVAVIIASATLIAGILVGVWIFGGKMVGPVLEEEKPRIEAWIAWKDLNLFGDPKGTVYKGGSPDFDEASGEAIERYEYIRSNHRERPWNDIDPSWLKTFAPGEIGAFEAWVSVNKLNRYGDPMDTMYLGGNPLFIEAGGYTISLDEYVLKFKPLRPWLSHK
jgi:hypothetical protein